MQSAAKLTLFSSDTGHTKGRGLAKKQGAGQHNWGKSGVEADDLEDYEHGGGAGAAGDGDEQ